MKLVPVYFMNELLEEQLLYQLLLYLPFEVLKAAGAVRLEQVLEKAGELAFARNTSPEVKQQIKEQLPLLQKLMDHRPDLKSSRIEAMSWQDRNHDGSPDYPEIGLIACVVINSGANTISVEFRGTPAGAWMDNGRMLIGDREYTKPYVDRNGITWEYLSPMQGEAMDYISEVLDRYGQLWQQFACRYVAGHSKGGNQAQLAGILYHDYFDIAISIDGPGMSKALIQEFHEKLGDLELHAAVNRLYGVHAANDYVHCLGESLIPVSNTIWVKEYDIGIPLLGAHYLRAVLDPETGAIMPFTLEPGPVAFFVRKLSEVAMELPVDERSAVFMSLMGFAQMFIGRTLPVYPEHEDWIRFVADLDNGTIQALGIILCVLLNTEEGKDFREYLNEIKITEKLNLFCDQAVRWYQMLPLDEKFKKAKGVAAVLMVRVALLAVLTKVISMAEILQQMRGPAGGFSGMGMTLMAAFTQLVGVLLNGYMGAVEKMREELHNVSKGRLQGE